MSASLPTVIVSDIFVGVNNDGRASFYFVSKEVELRFFASVVRRRSRSALYDAEGVFTKPRLLSVVK